MTEPQDASSWGFNDDAMIGFDADGRVLSVSVPAAQALGYTRPEELAGVTLAALVGDEAAISLLDTVVAAEEQEALADAAGNHFVPDLRQSGTVTFARQDGSRISLNTIVTPETSGGWITLIDPATGGTAISGTVPASATKIDVACVLRRLAVHSTGNVDSVDDLCGRFAGELRATMGTDAVVIARSTGISGLYETLAHSTRHGPTQASGAVELPTALVPGNHSAPVAVESLESLALFEPAVIAGEEATGALIAARAELAAGVHLLVITIASARKSWSDETVLLLEAAALTLSGTLRAAELGRMLAATSRSRETVRQIGLLASRDHDGEFLDAARRVIARRLPIAAISIHAADPVTARCYAAASSDGSDQRNGALAPGFDWPLAGSLEQRVLKTGTPVFISASSPERIGVPPATIAHWRASGLQAVVAIPLREAGEVIAVLLAGFSSAVSDPAEVISLLESISPAVYLGVGLSDARSSAAPGPGDAVADAGFVSPKELLAIADAAISSPDSATLFASVTEWLAELVPCARIAWGTFDPATSSYHRIYRYETDAGPSAAPSEGEETAQVEAEESEALGTAALGVAEPGHPPGEIRSMRAAASAGRRVLGIVTAWERAGQPFTTDDLAKLERICKVISAPLDRILQTEALRTSQRRLEIAVKIGSQAAEFHEPAQALRSVRPMIAELFPHKRALLIEIDEFADMALVRYDSGAAPNEPGPAAIPLSSLPSLEIAISQEPHSISLDEPASERHPVFGKFASLLSIPVNAGDGPAGALLLLGEQPVVASPDQVRLSGVVAGQLTGAQAGWLAYRSTRDSTRELRETQKQLNLLLDGAPVALISVDLNGVCNRLEGHGLDTLGIKREDMLGKSIFELTGKLPQLEDAIRQALRGIPATATTSIGSHFAEVWAQPVTEIDGTVTGVTLVGYDVSERIRGRLAASEIRELQAKLVERSRIVTTVSHELRNQLTSIIACADVLSVRAEELLNEQQAHALSIIQKTSARLDTMISDLLGLDYELHLTDVDVSNLMLEIVDAQQPIFSSTGQSLSLNLPAASYAVRADQLRLSQVVTNLLSNASKYSPPGAAVAIDVSVADGDLQISVTDTGPGIPADQLGRVWDSGTRLTGSNTRTVQGSGLGLYIARKIMDLHGGSASIDSEVGVGTTVTVTLPGATLVEHAEGADGSAENTGGEATAVADSGRVSVKARPKAKPAAGRQTHRRRRS